MNRRQRLRLERSIFIAFAFVCLVAGGWWWGYSGEDALPADDIALALAAERVRIEAPIPGKSLVGVEVPNSFRAIVHLREILQTEKFKKAKSKLTLPLGRDVAGKPMIANLETMPHLLVAGATGSGKSVAMNTFLISLLYQNSPNPFKHSTQIQYNLPVTTHTRLVVYSLAGRRVTTLVDEQQTAGHYNVSWDGRDSLGRQLANGVYFYRIEAGDYIATRKLLVVR